MKKRKGKTSTFRISNRLAYTLIAIGVFISLGAIAYAATPGVHHDVGEIDVPAGCSDGQVLKLSGGSWVCGDDNGGSYSLTCPSDMALIPASVGHGEFCIEKSERASTNLIGATATCGNANRRLCYADQIKTAYTSGTSGLTGMANGYELIHDSADTFSFSIAYVHIIQNSQTVTHAGSPSYPYRCCSS